jgi:DNA-binding transcriptional ArsR family regulator
MRICACVDAQCMNDDHYRLQAEVLKALAHPSRLEIIHRLAAGPSDVGGLAAPMGLAQPNVSQHLAVMRSAGVVNARRFGREVRYSLADPDIVAACDLMRRVLDRRVARLADLSFNSRPTAESAGRPTR